MCLSIHSSSKNLQHEIDSGTGSDGLMSSRDKTCQDCFCNSFARSGNVSLLRHCKTNLCERISSKL